MSKHITGPEVERLIQLFSRIPGLGPRSARRAILYLIKKKETLLEPLSRATQVAVENIRICSVCGNIDTNNPCTICNDRHRDPSILIIVEDVADLWALERAGIIKAYYHVLGGCLSALNGVGPDNLNIKKLLKRVSNGSNIKEIILAVNATVEGQTTAYYITEVLADFKIQVTRLAHGIPVGGELDYLDEGTLAAALRARV